jgi:hypothetical protein
MIILANQFRRLRYDRRRRAPKPERTARCRDRPAERGVKPTLAGAGRSRRGAALSGGPPIDDIKIS